MQQQIRGLGPLHLDDCEDDGEDLGDLCNAETYGLVQLTSHNMRIAHVTGHFLVHLWKSSFHRVPTSQPACQPSAFFLTFSTNNRIRGVFFCVQFQGEEEIISIICMMYLYLYL